MTFRPLKSLIVALVGTSLWACAATAAGHMHPSLSLDPAAVADMRAHYAASPLFADVVASTQARIDAEMLQPINVPVPKDPGGGYTHEQHKKNYKSISDAGFLYQLTRAQPYADYVKRLLMAYASLYPTLGDHPGKKEQAPGRLFWQNLNDSVWLVVSIQGYDAVYDSFTPDERATVENNLFRPMAKFLSETSRETFDRIHNHATWATAAVGMTGYVIGDQDLVERALLGSDKSGKSGFLRQVDELFSPDGYYAEGPYYQRYALMPFVLFAKAIESNEPERKIFARRDGVLVKAVYAAIQLTYDNRFFPINDALKEKGLDTVELMHAIAIAYDITHDASLLPIARFQRGVVLTGDGFKLSRALDRGLDKPFPFRSAVFRDGAGGDRGALVVLRAGAQPDDQVLVMKNTSQGMGHGHFDKLGWLFYDNGQEIIRDYGAARFLNVEAKHGGGYLPENKSWAKQTVAHNTLVVDAQSQFDANADRAELHDPVALLFDQKPTIQVAAASMEGADPGVRLVRTMALIQDDLMDFPFVLDVLKVTADGLHQYDLPLHYNGQLMAQNFDITSHAAVLKPLGADNGYQHLWLRAEGVPNGNAQVTWLKNRRFYTATMLGQQGLQVLFTQLGANDPEFNLRNENSLVFRVPNTRNTSFVSVLEPHGEFNPVQEYTVGSHSQIRNLSHTREGVMDYVQVDTVHGKSWGLALSYDTDPAATHSLTVAGKTVSWSGFYQLFEIGSQQEAAQ